MNTTPQKRLAVNWKGCAAAGLLAVLILGLGAGIVVSSLLGLAPWTARPEATATPGATETSESAATHSRSTSTPRPSSTPPAATATLLPQTPVAPAVSTPSPSSPGTGFDYGIQVHLFHLDAGYVCELVDNIQFRWIKHQIEWKEFEPAKGQYRWQPIDEIVNAADDAGLNVLLSVVKAPNWARGGQTQEDGPPQDYRDYGNFMGALAQRYCGRVQAYEIWNEQNLKREWNTGRPLSAAEYVELLHVAYDRVKAACPSAIVVSGGPTPVGYTSATAIDDFQYLRQMYEAGLKNYCDAVGVHPSGFNNPPDWRYPPGYSEPGDSESFRGNRQFYFLNTIEGYHEIMTAFGDGDRKLWATEFGWASIENLTPKPNDGYEYAADNTELEQAEYLFDALQIGRQKGYMGVMFVWNLNFAPAGGAGDERAAFGILREDWSQRPAYQTLDVARSLGELP
ncbi:MAG TPA: cellulase family glycosylhydrolase [Anaerolineae bacterium]|nr:cellulase family glycosylhydrolase [Anaerolineae bacterium]